MSNSTLNSTGDSADQPEAAGPRPAQEYDPAVAEQIAEIADAVAELKAARVAEDVAGRAARRQIRPFEAVMITLLAISLLIHALTVARLLSVRSTLRAEVEQLADTVQATKQQRVRYNLPIDQRLPIDIDVPIKRSLDVPINTEVQIKQDVTLPVDTGFGVVNIPVPIDAKIPINTTVPISFDQTINISTTVPIKLDVPIQVDMGSNQIAGYLDRLYAALIELRDKL
jgi:hypothetical protein